MDREKVIKGLERCKLYNKVNCDKCPYDYNGRGNGKSECTAELATDALSLLKEQEAVKPIKKDTVEITARYEFDCPCGAPLLIGQPYCADCGRSVKWE